MKKGFTFYDGLSNPRFIEAVLFNSPFGCAIMDKGGMFKDANEAFLHFLGYTNSELQKLSFQQVTFQSDMMFDMEMYNDILKGERESYEMVKRYVKKNGELVWANLKVCAVRGETGSIDYFIKHVSPIVGHEDILSMISKKNVSGMIFSAWFVRAIFITLLLAVMSCLSLVLHFMGYF